MKDQGFISLTCYLLFYMFAKHFNPDGGGPQTVILKSHVVAPLYHPSLLAGEKPKDSKRPCGRPDSSSMWTPALVSSHLHCLSPSHPTLWHAASLTGNHMLINLPLQPHSRAQHSSANRADETTRSLNEEETAYT